MSRQRTNQSNGKFTRKYLFRSSIVFHRTYVICLNCYCSIIIMNMFLKLRTPPPPAILIRPSRRRAPLVEHHCSKIRNIALQWLTLLICIQKARDWNRGPNTGYPAWNFRGFSQSFQANVEIVGLQYILPRSLPSTSLRRCISWNAARVAKQTTNEPINI